MQIIGPGPGGGGACRIARIERLALDHGPDTVDIAHGVVDGGQAGILQIACEGVGHIGRFMQCLLARLVAAAGLRDRLVGIAISLHRGDTGIGQLLGVIGEDLVRRAEIALCFLVATASGGRFT